MQLMIDIGKSLFGELVQIVLGCSLGILALKFWGNKLNKLAPSFVSDFLLIASASFCGIILPLDTYGIIPILIAAAIVGIRYYLIMPLLFGNIIFNMLVPYYDTGFIWRTGVYRILSALLVGICSGIIFRQIKINPAKILRIKIFKTIQEKTNSSFGYLKSISNYLNLLGPYMIAGVILNTVFQRYIFYKLMNSINVGRLASTTFSYVKGYDITTPVFLLAMIIFNILMDLKVITGLLTLFTWRGIVGYCIYISSWILLLVALNIVL